MRLVMQGLCGVGARQCSRVAVHVRRLRRRACSVGACAGMVEVWYGCCTFWYKWMARTI
ncbi:hypothetical protein HMPREF9248_0385 [Fannyhessea vaginae PB189-T1-4]|uniref:Uncharacterized protein n=1 Tax=Fannyhessea vaginae PB189-T1-4 TaxID=866774 RepID=A0ABP2J594_9ACTN|nr:hypothetical protein HMPREF9248_0385 [Fannyhessea vaginae PB189-T1-4]